MPRDQNALGFLRRQRDAKFFETLGAQANVFRLRGFPTYVRNSEGTLHSLVDAFVAILAICVDRALDAALRC